MKKAISTILATLSIITSMTAHADSESRREEEARMREYYAAASYSGKLPHLETYQDSIIGYQIKKYTCANRLTTEDRDAVTKCLAIVDVTLTNGDQFSTEIETVGIIRNQFEDSFIGAITPLVGSIIGVAMFPQSEKRAKELLKEELDRIVNTNRERNSK